MNKIILTLSFFLFVQSVKAQDTVRVKAFDYNSITRDTSVVFPDGSESYRQILMQYSMRCKGARVSTGSNRNLGCGEWDYSCNTYIEDNSKTDSLAAVTSDYSISNFSGSDFNYSNSPTNNYYRTIQRNVTVDSIADSSSATIGQGNHPITFIIPISNNPESGYAGKSQFVFSAAEMLSAGVTAGQINAISLGNTNSGLVSNLQIRILATSIDSFDLTNVELAGFTSVYSDDVSFDGANKTLYFHTPFVWDGKSNLLFEFTTNSKSSTLLKIKSHEVDSTVGITAFAGHSLYFDGTTNYVEADNYKGIIGTNDRTIEAWIKTSTVNGEICSWGSDVGGEKWVFRVNGDGTLRTEVNGGGVNGTTKINDNKWHHVACVFSGTDVNGIKHYVDGNLETNGTVTNRTINTTAGFNVRVSKGVNNRFFRGEIDGVRIWNVALSETELTVVKNRLLAPQDARITLNYKFDVVNDDVVKCSANTPRTGKIVGNPTYNTARALSVFKDFYVSYYRPNIKFHQGKYSVSVQNDTTYDKVPNHANLVTKYAIKSNKGSTLDDEKIVSESSNKWNADTKEYYYDENNILYDSVDVKTDGTINVGQLAYTRRWPSRLEIMSFVTPYGINVDLGPVGKTWTFDVTDFTPILKGEKRIFLSRGGQNQEEMDIEFLFIKGTPAREVLDISQIWPTQQYSPNYTQIMANDVYFPALTFNTNEDAKGFKIRSAITGHGQEGEFIPRNHFIKANDTTFTRSVWKACGNNPVYPQGGTWIYDRAGWCPGMATDIAEYDLTNYTFGGEKLTLDYGVETGSGDSRYIVNNQLVSYGDYKFNHDVAIIDILEPSNKVKHARNNPMCINPKMEVKNHGKQLITGLTIEYWVNNPKNKRRFTWPCHLSSGKVETVYFPIDDGVWSSAIEGNSKFIAQVVTVNGETADENPADNIYSSDFDFPEVYPPHFYLFYRTNNAASETSVTLKDEWGKVVFERNAHSNSTLYRDTLSLGLGCYQLTIDDTDNDGINFWANNDGSGFFRFWEVGGSIIKTIQPDFGSQTKLNFTVTHTLNVPERNINMGYMAYPNPTNHTVTIDGGDLLDAQVKLFSTTGQLLQSVTNLNNNELVLDLNTYPSGMYLIKILKNGHTWTQKIIKN